MRILVRAHKSPFQVADASKTLAKNLIGNNVGNLVFSQAVYRLLSTRDAQIDARKFTRLDPKRVNDTYDMVVVPLADAFRKSFADELRAMTDLFNHLTIPVVVLGVGCQGPLSGRIPASSLDEVVTDFVTAVLNRSASMGVRGEVTAAYLKRLGFGDHVVDVVGCPSMFMAGPDLAVGHTDREVDQLSRISMNISPYVPAMAPVSVDHAERYPNLVYTAQDHLTLGMMLTGTYFATRPQPQGSATTMDHPLLAQGRTRFCLDPSTWMRYLSGFDYSFGSRIHGNIVALLAGIPATVLAHDSRTLELADYHEIPRQVLTPTTPIDAASLYERSDWGPTVSGHAGRWARMTAFLERNDLRHTYLPGESPARFDHALAATKFPAPVHVGDRSARVYAVKKALGEPVGNLRWDGIVRRASQVRRAFSRTHT